MTSYTLDDLIFVCSVLHSSVKYSTYEKGAMERVILILEKLQEMFENVKEAE